MTFRHQFIIGCALALAGQVLWFAMLYPLVPKGSVGWAIATGSGLAATLWATGSVLAISWLRGQSKMRLLCNLAGLAIALSLGVGIFILALHRQDLLADHFSYFGK